MIRLGFGTARMLLAGRMLTSNPFAYDLDQCDEDDNGVADYCE